MVKIKVLKQPRTKSRKVVVEILQDALKTTRHERVTGIAVVMLIGNKFHDSDWSVAKGGDISALIGGIERVKDNILAEWKKHS